MFVLFVSVVLCVQDHAIFIVGGEFLALILAGEGAQESNDGGNFSITEFHIALVESHIAQFRL